MNCRDGKGQWSRLLVMLVVGALSSTQLHAGTRHYYYTDPQGTVLAKADAQGNIIATYDYAPYGSAVTSLGTPPNGPGYTGHVNDPDTGLIYMQARYYDPITGRFLSTDPVAPSPGDAFTFNRYNYANNNPIRFTDPDGRCPMCVVGAVVGTMAVGAGVGAGTDYLVQKAFNPGQPVNMNEVKVAAALGAVSGGSGMLAVSAVRTGVMSVTKAVAANVVVNGVAGAGGRAVQGHMDGTPATSTQIAAAGLGNAAGTLAANTTGVLLGDFSQAASQGAAANMSSAAINSPAGIGAHIANNTAAVGIGAQQSVGQAAASQGGQAVAQGMVAAEQKKIEEAH
ncbi:RHS repeat-associated core domain-containing protein [Rhodanobacter denitrificans]|nr:RHS repeat-associated core domain-containing protein [Rhodanobacter denitrificans]